MQRHKSTKHSSRKTRFQVYGSTVVDTRHGRTVYRHGSPGALKVVAEDLCEGKARVRSDGEIMWA